MKKDGYGSCPAHYNAKKDVARDKKQTGNTMKHFFKIGEKTADGKGHALHKVSKKTYLKNR